MPETTVGGTDLYYIAPRGLGDGVPLLLVHGAAGSSRHWSLLMPWLAPGFFPVALDLPGHGASGGWVSESVGAAVRCLNDFLGRLGVARPVYLVGHSLGGLIALKFALTYPERVEKLVLMATAAQINLHPDFLRQATTGEWDLPLMRQSFAPEVPDTATALVLDDLRRTRLSPRSTDFLGTAECDLRPQLPTLKRETLIIAGDNDVIISPRKSGLLEREIRRSQLTTIPQAGHYLHIEQPALVAEKINDFWQAV